LRDIFYPIDENFEDEILVVTGDPLHHLSVTRIRPNEEILILNGKGKKLFGKILSIGKKTAEIKILSSEFSIEGHHIGLAIGLPKKEAFEDILKMATELGVRNIYPLKTDFSQFEYVENERFQRILESALIQSNNAYFPVIHSQMSLSDFLATQKKPLVFFNSQPKVLRKIPKLADEKIILIGPEGGFSGKEIEKIRAYEINLEIHLPTPILRAPTAVATSVGYLLSLDDSEK
jgi:16S rRNA (uracil1498-N3)-methyltransferase